MAKYPKTEEDYMAESDAHTIMEYRAIIGDDKRKSAAMKCIDRKLKLLKEAKASSKKTSEDTE